MRVKSRVLIVAAMAAAFFGAAPAFASDESPALPAPEAPAEAPVTPEDPSVEEPTPAPEEPTPAPEEPAPAPAEPERVSEPTVAEAGPVTPIEQDPNYTG
ncbi:hypothetical protein [Nocardiopsis sp. B62]|uniref:hypothetical protein n=1 Tax=Nocardiopsis sp. B62 TaxID=2824874 RepID=UPI001B374D87|nr:hypothetical protein [Nocardiopsis sp. B62]MBQ1081754.1 hypothetical protein [Nocardiopsis sp. B62]